MTVNNIHNNLSEDQSYYWRWANYASIANINKEFARSLNFSVSLGGSAFRFPIWYNPKADISDCSHILIVYDDVRSIQSKFMHKFDRIKDRENLWSYTMYQLFIYEYVKSKKMEEKTISTQNVKHMMEESWVPFATSREIYKYTFDIDFMDICEDLYKLSDKIIDRLEYTKKSYLAAMHQKEKLSKKENDLLNNEKNKKYVERTIAECETEIKEKLQTIRKVINSDKTSIDMFNEDYK